jgi:hypothetical protein
VSETIEHPIRIVSGPEGAIEIAESGLQVKGIEFVVEAVEDTLVIEKLPGARLVVKSSSH